MHINRSSATAILRGAALVALLAAIDRQSALAQQPTWEVAGGAVLAGPFVDRALFASFQVTRLLPSEALQIEAGGMLRFGRDAGAGCGLGEWCGLRRLGGVAHVGVSTTVERLPDWVDPAPRQWMPDPYLVLHAGVWAAPRVATATPTAPFDRTVTGFLGEAGMGVPLARTASRQAIEFRVGAWVPFTAAGQQLASGLTMRVLLVQRW